MPTWSGWQNQLLNRAGIIVTPPNRTFMSQWASHAPGSCKNNPVDLSKSVSGSTRCGDTVAGFGRSQNYATHAQAARAFQLSIATDWVQPLQSALNTGNPFQIGDRSDVVAVLKRWGSPQFANWYENTSTGGGGGGGSGGGGIAPRTHKAWVDLQKSLNKKSHVALKHAGQANHATLTTLRRIHKVRP